LIWWIAVGLAAMAALILYWQLVIAEGVYLGQKIVTLLYDRVAHKYNDIKEFDEQDEYRFVGLPLSRALGYNFQGILLDVATGTGRLPLTMRRMSWFQGKLVGLDHSAKMLAMARQTLPDLPLVLADAMKLPFAENSINAVTCLEALEFLPSPVDGLEELVRVLSPGGVLLTTNRIGWEAKLMPGKTWKSSQFRSVLEQMPLTDVFFTPWLTIYEQVWARKEEITGE
jgi:ubiquinone/menaquinone biosynthesis C-methylase UbiE